jgi:RNA polymerase sigma factor (sigma-70 family)
MEVKREHIEGCRRGDSTSQREVYDLLLPYLNAICGRCLKDTSHRKDVLQESFILIFRNLNQFDPIKGEFHSWASRITINQSLKHNRSSKSRFYTPLESERSQPEVNPEVINQLSNEELAKFLKTMPPKFYEVFNLFIIDGFTHEEIAEMLEIKISLSRKRLARARTWLQEKPKSLNAILGDYRFSIS